MARPTLGVIPEAGHTAESTWADHWTPRNVIYSSAQLQGWINYKVAETASSCQIGQWSECVCPQLTDETPTLGSG